MTTLRLRACHYATGQLVELLLRGGRIAAVTDLSAEVVDLSAGWVAPALFDLQINGCAGVAFNSPALTIDGVRKVVAVCRQHGIAGLCPTLVTASTEALLHGFRTLRQACEIDSTLAHALPVFHLEGPYISPEDGPRGAHPRKEVRPPRWDEFQRLQEAAGGRIRLVTLAPEIEGALPFIERLTGEGVVAAIGHTAASGAQIRAAISAGARLSTHLGNGSHALLPRHDNYIWEQLAADDLFASVICDGFHLPPAVMRCLVRAKTPALTILTCDASSLAGLPAGQYREWDQNLTILPSGKIEVTGTSYLAGSGVFLDACLTQTLAHTGVSLREAIEMAAVHPRRLLRLPPVDLIEDAPADLVLFDWEPGQSVRVAATIVDGAVSWAR
jgi:N-acetylglucosamine-6-phosphate deacetylase